MLSWRDVAAVEERNRDMRHRAEKERLIRKVLAQRNNPGYGRRLYTYLRGLKPRQRSTGARRDRVMVKQGLGTRS